MRYIPLLLIFFCASPRVHCQYKFNIGLHLDAGANIFQNTLKANKNHYHINTPTALGFGVSSHYYFDKLNALESRLYYSRKIISINYEINEPNIPYTTNDNFNEKINAYGLAVSYKRSIPIKKMVVNAGIGLFAEYNTVFSIGISSNGEGTSDPIGVIEYRQNFDKNFDDEKFTYGLDFSLSSSLWFNRRIEMAIFAQVPFNTLQKNASAITNYWKYQNVEYNHNLNYKGYLYVTGVRLSYHVYRK